jgi:hypothetical protein
MSKEKPGPTSPEGKRMASQNAAKHHLTGRAPLIDGESPEAFEALLLSWQTDYPTDTTEAAKLVQDAALCEWILLRVQRQSDPIFNNLFNKGMANWDEANHKQYQLTQRYLTAAERKLERHRRNIFQYRRELRAEAREQRAAEVFASRQENAAQAGDEAEEQAASAPRKSDMTLTQYAYVSEKNGETVTRLIPPNANILRANGRLLESAIVKRQIRFEGAIVPDEYAWCQPLWDDLDLPPDKKVMMIYHTLRTFNLAVVREAAGGGHVKEWPELYEEADSHSIEAELAREERINRE